MWLLLREKVAYQAAFVLVFDTCKQLRAQRFNCLWTVERHTLVDFPAAEMARLAPGFKDRFDLRWEIDSLGQLW